MIAAAEKDARAVAGILATKLPAELVSEILDSAECFGHQIVGFNEKPDRVRAGFERKYEEMDKEGEGYSDIKVYLIAQIPDFMALHKDTAGRGGLGGGRPGRVRKIVFRLRCRDQGWSSHPEIEMTYQWGRSRIDVEIWRKRETGAGGGDEMYKVGESLLQRNKVALADVLEYEVSWRWDQDKPEDEFGNVDLVGRHEKNGQFVRELRGGDEIRIFMKAFYRGWECRIEKCEVECFWAI
ncbi:hypothetical protein TWF106_007902 [Orbilia oligospora]|uniref:Uncharacterized protein n=1 Tax=Orbilia oligospora TaxID=2813651 RepID=A0A7C8K3P0_ORBOL|nr:hypothetical protein TWF788_001797 [Orbilia oligospora]KAF3202118.1 hypothetical protein TWF679_011101 [Orbilia oligospora]KAF3217596.1 hypothetical protein TWF106_007902 [Orbilia oligospora]